MRKDPRPVTFDPGRAEYTFWYDLTQKSSAPNMAVMVRRAVRLFAKLWEAKARGADVLIREKDKSEASVSIEVE